MRRRQQTLGRLLLGGLLSLYMIGCQLPGSTPPTPVVIIQNAQGTPLAGAGVGPTVAPITPTPGPNLITNGSFASDWSTGWQRDTGQAITGQSVTQVVSTSQGSSGKAVRLVHDGTSYLELYQVVSLDSLDVILSAQINPMAEASCRGILKACTGVAAIGFVLRDAQDKELGRFSYLYPGSKDQINMASTATTRFILLQPNWQTIRFNLGQEIINTLPKLNGTAVKKVVVSLTAGSVGDCDPGQCYAEVQATDIQITAK
ncbi:MAG: hypothetical protein WCP31_10665 [Chloroflexales bacterium]